ncbi:MAG TPA: asparagine synthase-related protein [Myxococcales bacterium LLY-WYZ-16_1]|nr:asparagine synthase-related protein [Myxococcales bacterium LLY-WYZ-16_1]
MKAGLCGMAAWDPERPLVPPGSTQGTASVAGGGVTWMARSTRGLSASVAEDLERRLVGGIAGRLEDAGALAEVLSKRGHRLDNWKTADLVLAAFREWGTACLDQLRGPFALAIFDRRQRRAFLARDRLGRVPLVVHRSRDRLVFATDLHGVLQAGSVPRVLDPRAATAFLRWGFVPSPATGVRDVLRLPPAGVAVATADGIELKAHRPVRFSDPSSDDLSSQLERLRELLQHDAAASPRRIVHLRADAPSQILAALHPEPVRTVSVETDAPTQRIVASVGTHHRSVPAKPSEAAFEGALDGTSLLSSVPDLLEQAALLGGLRGESLGAGDGAEAVFGDDPALPACLARRSVERSLPDRWGQRLARIGRRFPGLPLPVGDICDTLLLDPDEHRILECLQADFRQVSPVARVEPDGPDDLSRLQQVAVRHRFGDGRIETCVELATHFDVPFEMPFLREPVVELAERLPARARVDGGQAGTGLKRLAQLLLPGRVEPDFPRSVDLGERLRGPLRERCEAAFFAGGSSFADLLHVPSLRRRWYEHQLGLQDHGRWMWRLLCFEGWSRRVFGR